MPPSAIYTKGQRIRLNDRNGKMSGLTATITDWPKWREGVLNSFWYYQLTLDKEYSYISGQGKFPFSCKDIGRSEQEIEPEYIVS